MAIVFERLAFILIAGRPIEHLPSEIVMRSEDLVDAALTGLDRGAFASIPSLQDGTLFDAYERPAGDDRQALDRHPRPPLSRRGLTSRRSGGRDSITRSHRNRPPAR